MVASDLPAVLAVSAAAFGKDLSDAGERAAWRQRLTHPWETDPAGAFVEERDGRVVGVAQAIRRERLWVLSLLTVDPETQSRGSGRALLKAALSYAPGCTGRLIVSSNDPRAMRLYGLSGFQLLPTFEARGTLDRRKLPAGLPDPTPVAAGELDRLEPIARAVRGAPHTPDLAIALDRGGLILRLGDEGYVVTRGGGGIFTLLARDGEVARALLWAGLAAGGDGEDGAVRWMTGAQDWAVGVVLRAGLQLAPYGALAVSGRPGTLRPFIPSGPFA